MENEKFAENLATLLKYRGLSQQDLAKELGCTEQAVSTWIRGQSYPRPAKINGIAKVLDVEVPYLIGGYELFDEEGIPNFEPDPVKPPTAAEVYGSPDVVPFPGQLATDENVSDFLSKIVMFKDIIEDLDKLTPEQIMTVRAFIKFIETEGLS